MLFEEVQADLLAARKLRTDKDLISDLTCLVSDAMGKCGTQLYLAHQRGEEFKIPDEVVLGIIKNNIKNLEKAIKEMGFGSEIGVLQKSIDNLSAYLPEALTEQELQEFIAEVGATSMGEGMKLLKKYASDQGKDLDNAMAAKILRAVL